jgi:hypothetical protein
MSDGPCRECRSANIMAMATTAGIGEGETTTTTMTKR